MGSEHLYTAVSLLGANVMPHSFYLHRWVHILLAQVHILLAQVGACWALHGAVAQRWASVRCAVGSALWLLRWVCLVRRMDGHAWVGEWRSWNRSVAAALGLHVWEDGWSRLG